MSKDDDVKKDKFPWMPADAKRHMHWEMGLNYLVAHVLIRMIINVSVGHAVLMVVFREGTYPPVFHIADVISVPVVSELVIFVFAWLGASYCVGVVLFSPLLYLLSLFVPGAFFVLVLVKKFVLGDSPPKWKSELWDWSLIMVCVVVLAISIYWAYMDVL